MNGYGNTITYWPAVGKDGYGSTTFGPPVKVDARWEDKQEAFYLPTSEMSVSKAVIYAAPKKNVSFQPGGYVYNGLDATLDPTIIVGAEVIRAVLRIPDLRNVRAEIRLML